MRQPDIDHPCCCCAEAITLLRGHLLDADQAVLEMLPGLNWGFVSSHISSSHGAPLSERPNLEAAIAAAAWSDFPQPHSWHCQTIAHCCVGTKLMPSYSLASALRLLAFENVLQTGFEHCSTIMLSMAERRLNPGRIREMGSRSRSAGTTPVRDQASRGLVTMVAPAYLGVCQLPARYLL